MSALGEAVYATALEALDNGIGSIPIAANKKPIGTWKTYIDRLPTRQEIDTWFAPGLQQGIAFFCGATAGGLEMLEMENPDVLAAYSAATVPAAVDALWDRVRAGYESNSGGGSTHILWRCDAFTGNLKLAERPLEGRLRQVLIETRGMGGLTIEPPSGGRTHPTGNSYTQIQGGISTIVTITESEREDLIALARTFNEVPARPAAEPREPQRGNDRQTDGVRPGDAFNQQMEWFRLLTESGWTFVREVGEEQHWRREGKTSGISATVNHRGSNLFKAFTTSTSFDPDKTYSKFGFYAHIHHDGDFSAARRDLFNQGYGRRFASNGAPVPPPNEPPDEPPNDPPPPEQGSDPEAPPPPPERPEIDSMDQHLERISARVLRALVRANDPPRIFNQGNFPVRITRSTTGEPMTQVLTEDRMSFESARAALFYKDSEKAGRQHASPPMRVVRDILAHPEFPFPPLLAITESPTFAPDGTFPTRPGYHAASETFYAPARGFTVPPVPDDPAQSQIDAARDLIVNELLVDFPFVGEAERAHAVAMLLLPILRGLIDGQTPLHLIEKPTAGTGASLLADLVARVATGRPVGAMIEGRDEDEWRKRVTAKLRNGPPVVLIDNLRRRLDSAVISSALTSPYIEDRILGTSDNIRIPVRCVWIASGNNPALSSEITRRTVRIRMDAKQDRPWLREEFRHYPLFPWVNAERSNLVAACLTLGRAWIAAGKPVPVGAYTLGSFEEWSNVLSGVLDVAGIPGFLSNLSEFYEVSDTEGIGIRSFLSAWWETHHGAAVGVAALFAIAMSDDSQIDLGNGNDRSQKTRLGRMLGDLRDRHYQLDSGDTVRVSPAGERQRAQLWKLVLVSERGELSERGESARTDYQQEENTYSNMGFGEISSPRSPRSHDDPDWGDVGDVGDVSQAPPRANQHEQSRNNDMESGETHPPYPPHPPDDEFDETEIPFEAEVRQCDRCGALLRDGSLADVCEECSPWN